MINISQPSENYFNQKQQHETKQHRYKYDVTKQQMKKIKKIFKEKEKNQWKWHVQIG